MERRVPPKPRKSDEQIIKKVSKEFDKKVKSDKVAALFKALQRKGKRK